MLKIILFYWVQFLMCCMSQKKKYNMHFYTISNVDYGLILWIMVLLYQTRTKQGLTTGLTRTKLGQIKGSTPDFKMTQGHEHLKLFFFSPQTRPRSTSKHLWKLMWLKRFNKAVLMHLISNSFTGLTFGNVKKQTSAV